MSLFILTLVFFALSGIICTAVSAVVNTIQRNQRVAAGSILGAFGSFAVLIGAVWLHVNTG